MYVEVASSQWWSFNFWYSAALCLVRSWRKGPTVHALTLSAACNESSIDKWNSIKFDSGEFYVTFSPYPNFG